MSSHNAPCALRNPYESLLYSIARPLLADIYRRRGFSFDNFQIRHYELRKPLARGRYRDRKRSNAGSVSGESIPGYGVHIQYTRLYAKSAQYVPTI